MADGQGSARGIRSCARCNRTVEASAADYDTFEHMHYVCFHYEFEHRDDPDVECSAGGCPTAGISLPSLLTRTESIVLSEAGNTLAPAILALEAIGYVVTQKNELLFATAGNARFAAEDPVALLGLVRLAELRRPWRASDTEIDDVMGPLQPLARCLRQRRQAAPARSQDPASSPRPRARRMCSGTWRDRHLARCRNRADALCLRSSQMPSRLHGSSRLKRAR